MKNWRLRSAVCLVLNSKTCVPICSSSCCICFGSSVSSLFSSAGRFAWGSSTGLASSTGSSDSHSSVEADSLPWRWDDPPWTALSSISEAGTWTWWRDEPPLTDPFSISGDLQEERNRIKISYRKNDFVMAFLKWVYCYKKCFQVQSH